jgi:hypothetical protein
VIARRSVAAAAAALACAPQALAQPPALRVGLVPSVQTLIDSALHALARGSVDALALAASQLQLIPPRTPRGDRVLVATPARCPGRSMSRGRASVPTSSGGCAACCCASSPSRAQPETAVDTRLRGPAQAELAALEVFLPRLRREMARA